MNTYYIYKITNIVTGMGYIGQHKIPEKGEYPRSYFGRGIKLKSAIREYGRKNFIKEILEYIEDDQKREKVSERERFWIKEENTLEPNGYNILPGGIDGMTSAVAFRSAATRKEHGYKMSEDTKKKISASNKNKSKSEEHKQHLSEHHHLRTLHKIQHEDGSIEETFLSMQKIAKQYGTNPNTLLRRSAKKEFINGVYLLDIDFDKYECCSGRNSKEQSKKMCIDPIVGDTCNLNILRYRKRNSIELYKNIILKNCIIEDDKNDTRTNYSVTA